MHHWKPRKRAVSGGTENNSLVTEKNGEGASRVGRSEALGRQVREVMVLN